MNTSKLLQANNIFAGYDNKIINDDVSILIPKNKISVIIGANACGKSTLLKTMARLIQPSSGSITLDGKKISEIPSKELARSLGLLPQSPIVPEGITVADLVSRGRFPYQSFLKGLGKKDYEAVEEALEIMGITDIANRGVDVEECFVHCSRAIRESGIWNLETWPSKEEVPTALEIFLAHLKINGIDISKDK